MNKCGEGGYMRVPIEASLKQYREWLEYDFIKEMAKSKQEILLQETKGKIYKYIQFSDKNVIENNTKIDTLGEKSLWFGCPWKMNDPTEFFMSYDEDEFINATEKELFIIQSALFMEQYTLCSFSKVPSEYMWKEYSNQDNGICLEFYVEDFDWFYPVEYVDDKDSYSFISLWRKSQMVTAIDGKLCNNPLAYLPYVVKDRINKRTGKNSEKENEIRALYCAFTEKNLNNGVLYPEFKSDNRILG